MTGSTTQSDRASARAADSLRAVELIRRARSAPRAISAAGLRVRPDESRDMLRALALLRQPWQRIAWNYRDMIGELRFALQYRARALSNVHFYPAELGPGAEDEPIALALRNAEDPDAAKRVTLPPALCEAAEEELARLPLDSGMSFLGMWSENFDVAGDCWLYGRTDESGAEHWSIESAMKIEISTDGASVYMIDPAAAGQRRKLDLSEDSGEELYRLWVPHPVNSMLADSALRATLDTLEDIVSTGREMRAASRSRFSSNGVWMLPFGMFMADGTSSDLSDDPESNTFASDLTAAITSPITNEGDAGAMAPIILRGHRADIEAAVKGFIRFDREDSPMLIQKLTNALSRMGNSLDIPPEVITGMADVNHWTAWQIDSATAKHHIEPSARLMADSLTTSYLRAALLKRGFNPADVARVRVWFTLGSLTENPNRRQDALDAHDRGAIGPGTLRDALGFGEEDAPTQSELLGMIAMKQGVDVAWMTQVLAWMAEREDSGLAGLPQPPAPQAISGARPTSVASPPATAPAGQPTGTVPVTAPSAIAAAATPFVHTGLSGAQDLNVPAGQTETPYRLAVNDFTALLFIERNLRDKLTAECDKAINRAVERAGSRLRSKISKDREMSLAVRDIPSGQLCGHVGRTQTLALADLPFLLNEAFEGLYDTYAALVTGGLPQLLGKLAKTLRLSKDDAKRTTERLSTTLTQRIDTGWDYLAGALRARTERLLFNADLDDDPGEKYYSLIQPSVVRASLSLVGGLPESATGVDERGKVLGDEALGGIVNGETVREEVERHGGVDVGYTWVYGITQVPHKFEPHWDLEGERFENWADPKLSTAGTKYAWVGTHYRPGDHEGCMCDYVQAWALPAYAAQVDQQLRVPTQAMAVLIALADEDDRAGRTGTTAQYERERWRQVQDLQARFIRGESA